MSLQRYSELEAKERANVITSLTHGDFQDAMNNVVVDYVKDRLLADDEDTDEDIGQHLKESVLNYIDNITQQYVNIERTYEKEESHYFERDEVASLKREYGL